LRLDHFLKINGIAATGGHAKLLIQSGEVIVDGQVETRRRRKLTNGNTVHVGGKDFVVSGLSLEEARDEPA
jgi:ribosome-associated protein